MVFLGIKRSGNARRTSVMMCGERLRGAGGAGSNHVDLLCCFFVTKWVCAFLHCVCVCVSVHISFFLLVWI